MGRADDLINLLETSDSDKAYLFIHSFERGQEVRIGRVTFSCVRNQHGNPEFSKKGTKGTQWYHMEWLGKPGQFGMFPIGGSGQRLGPNTVEGVPDQYRTFKVPEIKYDKSQSSLPDGFEGF